MTKVDDILEGLQALADRRKFRAIDFYKPFAKQAEFHALGATKRERLLRAGNQIGKTYAGAAETAYHLTGEYPSWWLGKRIAKAPRGWVAGEGAVLVRDGPQTLLCGEPGVDASFGTGMIPKESFADKPSLSRGVTDAYDTIQVRHLTGSPSRPGRLGVVSDGVATLSFKSYDQGRKKFQTKTLDFGWCDEEPPEDIYSEMMARITATNGFTFITFTPLLGMSKVVSKFLLEDSPDRSDTVMTLWDVPGMTQEKVDTIMRGYPPYQRQARTMGVPMMGSGQVFPVDPDSITEDPLTFIPPEWLKLWGIDFGINHPFGAVLLAWDREADVIHVVHAIRINDGLPLQHSSAMKAIAANVKVSWPQDGTQRRDDGKPMSNLYKEQGLHMLPGHATWPDGSISTEAGVTEMYDRMTTGRFKVARTLMNSEWGQEFRDYHRDEEGKLVKIKDDLMSATRVAIMAKRYGQTGAVIGGYRRGRKEQTETFAKGVDFDVFA